MMLLAYDDYDGDYWEVCDGNDGYGAGNWYITERGDLVWKIYVGF